MSPALATALSLALGQADAGVGLVDVQSAASPRATLDAQASTDLLGATSVATDPGSGEPAELTAFELGVRAVVAATAFSRHAHLNVDYSGRQPIAGSLQNSPIHLLQRAELSIDVLDKRLYFGVGRFLAPSAVMLPVDGLRAQLHVWRLMLEVFGGRRAVTSTRSGNVELSTFLPAVGVSASLALDRVQADAAVTFSRDRVAVASGAAEQPYDQLAAHLRATARPFDWLVLGAELAVAQRASYVLGPTWSSTELRARTADVFYTYAFADLRPHSTLRVTYDFHLQNAGLFREGVRVDPSDPQLALDAFTPHFVDHRLRLRWRPFQLGWLGPDARLRVRPDRHEWRFGGRADLAPPWAKGLFVRASYLYEKMVATPATVSLPADRSWGSVSLGWRWSGLDLSAGFSNVQRSNLPLSSRTYTPHDDGPDRPVDLSPFMLEAQRLVFLRVFYGSRVWFAGLDFEQSLTDARERRVFAQLGARLEGEW